MPDYILILSRGQGFSPCTAHVIASDGSITDPGHTFYPVNKLIEVLESIGIMTQRFPLEMSAINSGIRTWIPLDQKQAQALLELKPRDHSW